METVTAAAVSRTVTGRRRRGGSAGHDAQRSRQPGRRRPWRGRTISASRPASKPGASFESGRIGRRPVPGTPVYPARCSRAHGTPQLDTGRGQRSRCSPSQRRATGTAFPFGVGVSARQDWTSASAARRRVARRGPSTRSRRHRGWRSAGTHGGKFRCWLGQSYFCLVASLCFGFRAAEPTMTCQHGFHRCEVRLRASGEPDAEMRVEVGHGGT